MLLALLYLLSMSSWICWSLTWQAVVLHLDIFLAEMEKNIDIALILLLLLGNVYPKSMAF